MNNGEMTADTHDFIQSKKAQMAKINRARKILVFSTHAWAAILVMCQLLFVIYLALGYGSPTLTGNLEGWNGNSSSAFVAGDTLGNVAFGMHVLLSIVMIVGGPLQFIPRLRNKYKGFHRFNGRVFITLAILISLMGLFLIWTRGTVGNTLMHALTSFNGVVIIICAFVALFLAIKRNIPAHKEWATRLFITANGVLYFRIILFAWFILAGGPVGIDIQTFTGPTVLAISIMCYVLPIIIYQLYLWVKASEQTQLMYVMTGFFWIISGYFAVGTFAVTMGNWLPIIMK